MYSVLHISPSYKPAYTYGGPTYSLSSLCNALVKYGCQTTVITTTANGRRELYVKPGNHYSIEGVQVQYYRRLTKDHSHFSPSLLYNVWCDCTRYDIVHIHSWWNLVSVLSTLICTFRGIRPIISIRGTLSAHTFAHGKSILKRIIHITLGKRLLTRSFIHTTTTKELDEVLQVVPGAKGVVIPNMVELNCYSERVEIRNAQTLRLLFLGRIHPVKNLELLLDSLESLSLDTWELDIAGDGDLTYVEKLKHKFTSSHHATWLGTITGDEKYAYLRKADLLVLLSHTENFANVVIESLSQGTPVLITKGVGISEYVLKHKLGWIVEPTKNAIQELLTYLINNKNELNDIRDIAKARIKSDFDVGSLTDSYYKAYQLVFENNIN